MIGSDGERRGNISKPVRRSENLDVRVGEVTRNSINRSVSEIIRKAADRSDR
jgi:hypothetical protein